MEHKPSAFGTDTIYDTNPFLVDDIAGKQNSIISAITTPTNCLIYRNQPPTIHVVNDKVPKLLQLASKELFEIPAIPDGVKALIINDNSIKSVAPLANCQSLELVDVSANLVSNFDMPVSPPNLKAIIAASNRMEKIATDAIFINLQVLNLSQNSLTEFDTLRFPNLRVLNLSFNQLIKFELKAQLLVELSLQNNYIDTFEITSQNSLERLDLSSNQINDISFVEQLPKLTHFSGKGNKLQPLWESFVVHLHPKTLIALDGKTITEGERAIHLDRVARAMKQAKVEKPHLLISEIRREFKAIKAIQMEAEAPEDIVSVWVARSRERRQRQTAMENRVREMKRWVCVDKDALTVYGSLVGAEIPRGGFIAIRLIYCPILRGSAAESAASALAQFRPTSLRLDHNMLNTLGDALFLRHFDSVRFLEIEGNLVGKMSLFRQFAAFVMPALEVINGEAIREAERTSGVGHFRLLLSVARGLDLEE